MIFAIADKLLKTTRTLRRGIRKVIQRIIVNGSQRGNGELLAGCVRRRGGEFNAVLCLVGGVLGKQIYGILRICF